MSQQALEHRDPPTTTTFDFQDASTDELCQVVEPTTEWLWEGYVTPGMLTLLTSQWKCGKTTLIATLLARMGAGGKLAGRDVRASRILYVSEEHRKLWSGRGRQMQIGPHARFICRPFRGRRPTLEQWRALIDHLVAVHLERGLDLVVIDSWSAFVPGSENDAGTVLDTLVALQDLTHRGVAVLILHHPGKGVRIVGQAARGSGALAANADIVIEMDGLSGPADDDRRRKLAAFSRFGATPRRLVIEWNADGTDYTALGDFNAPELDDGWQVMHWVLEDADHKLTRREILQSWPPDYCKPDPGTLWKWLDRAVADGRVLREGTGRRNDPFKHWLDGMEEVWKSDPLKLPPLDFPLDDAFGKRKTLAEVLAERTAGAGAKRKPGSSVRKDRGETK